ncbi:YihY/virulence factor BrkB family protein [Paracoccus liaowanqingii]|uniref:YihY/virulence factor BrkB family protein n=1 Tax=Paracoccus liaowanqingii TaxID=2560053 RepID=A0A4Z1CDC8_9RHOB|nr:YihY/virulence factor BrkB family protein [Paracoccus liaowanqingii]TGN44467.1 YihY/virulence factor BrkB family protein [Paracoccus liaowanqingii]
MTHTTDTDSGQAASAPTHIPASGWKDILMRVKAEIARDHISVVSAGIAFYTLLAIFPAIVAMISIAGLVFDPAEIASQAAAVADMLPAEAATILQDQIAKVSGGDETGTGLVALFGIVIALYGAMKGVMTLMEGLNIAYDEDETRGTVRLYLTAIALTLGLILGLIAGMALVILLPSLAAFGWLPPAVGTAIGWLKWPVLAVLTMLGLGAVYRFGPSRANPRWAWVSVGAVSATALWILGTMAFSVYAQNFGSYTETYGTLGGVIILLTWMWLSAFVVLAGAELNAETEQQTAQDTTTGAPEPMGQRDAVKADTPPSGKGPKGTDRRDDPSDRDADGRPLSAGAEVSLALVLLGSAAMKAVRKPGA